MKIGDKYSTSCPLIKCTGSVEGTFGGRFYVGETRIEYTQILNGKCDRCGFTKPEIFEVWDEQNDEFYISDRVVIPISDDSDISFPGLGKPVSEITPKMKYFLETGRRTN